MLKRKETTRYRMEKHPNSRKLIGEIDGVILKEWIYMQTTLETLETMTDEKLTPEEEAAILEYEKDKRDGVLITYSLEEIRRRLGLDN